MTRAALKYSAMCMQAGNIQDGDEPGAGVVKLGIGEQPYDPYSFIDPSGA